MQTKNAVLMDQGNKINNGGIGIDNLPEDIKVSAILTFGSIAKLAGIQEIPYVDAGFEDDKLKSIIQYYSIDPAEMEKELHYYAQELLEKDKVNEAWQILLAIN